MIAMNTTTLVTLSLCLGTLLLLLNTVRLVRQQRRDGARIARVEDVLQRMTRETISANVRVSQADRAVQHAQDRLDTLECRAAGGQRIESAVRVARQGAASAAVLKDLGLSDAEASLLMRLYAQHKIDDEPAHEALTPDTATSLPSSAPDSPSADDEEQIQALLENRATSRQAASLARLLAKADDKSAAA